MDDYGPLTPYLAASDISEIMVQGPNKIFVEQSGKLIQIDRRFSSESELMRVIRQLLASCGKTLTPQQPMLDTRLADGSRMTITVPPVTPQASFTIRRPSYRAQHLNELVARSTLSPAMADLLRMAVQLRLNILISGGTSCGKTTLLNAMAAGIPAHHRIVTIEDTFEISLPHTNWVQLETVFQGRSTGDTRIDMRDLVSHALHLRPDRILMGEVRGGEALDLLQAMNSGHDGCMGTIHASSPRDVVSRLETLVLLAGYEIPLSAIRLQISRALHLIIQMRRTPEGQRQITAITEVTGMQEGHPAVQDVFMLGQDRATGKMGFFPTGYMPTFVQHGMAQGLKIAANAFTAPHMLGREEPKPL